MAEALGVQPVERSRLSKQITVQLCRMISEGHLRPGDRLPSERELASRLNVSRTSLREALRELEIAGIVATRQGGGTYVRAFADDALLSPLLLMLDVRGDLVGDLIEVRIIFEPEIAARAAVRATDADLAELERLLQAQQRMVEANTQGGAWLLLDRQFHMAIARGAHNEVSVRVTSVITEMLQDARRHFLASDQRMHHAFTHHQRIVSAIRAANPLHAHEAMLRHLRDVETFVLQGITDDDVKLPIPLP